MLGSCGIVVAAIVLAVPMMQTARKSAEPRSAPALTSPVKPMSTNTEGSRSNALDKKQQAEIDALLRQMDEAQSRVRRIQAHVEAISANGAAGSTDLRVRYMNAIQAAVTRAWAQPNTLPKGVVCPVHVSLAAAGRIEAVHVDSGCPYDEAGRASVLSAVEHAQPLPYRGFEKVSQRNIILEFQVRD